MKNYSLLLILLIIGFISCSKDSSTSTGGLYSFYDEFGKWGFIDKEGTVILEPQWDEAYDFYMGFGIVSNNSLWGLIDRNGTEVIPLKYQGIGNFEPDMKSIFNPKFLARAKLNGLWGFIDEHDNVVIPFSYKMLNNFRNGLAAFRTDTKYGYLNESGNVIIPATYDGYGNFREGLAWVGILEGSVIKWGVINKTGETVIPFNYENPGGPTNKVISFQFVDEISPFYKSAEPSGFINTLGEWMFYGASGANYWYTGNFSEGLAPVGKDNNMGYINIDGNEVIPRQYYAEWGFVNGTAPVRSTSTSLWGYINKNGNVFIEPQYIAAWNFNEENVTWVQYPDSTYAYINTTGNPVWRATTKIGKNPQNPFSRAGIETGID